MAPPVLDHQVLGRVGADAVSGEGAQPLAGIIRCGPSAYGNRNRALLDPRKAATEAHRARAEVEHLSVDPRGLQITLLRLPGVATRRVEDLEGEVVIAHTAGCHHPLIEAGHQPSLDAGVAAGEVEVQPALPRSGLAAGLLRVGGGAHAPHHAQKSCAVGHRHTARTRPVSVGGGKGGDRLRAPHVVLGSAAANDLQPTDRQLQPGRYGRGELGRPRHAARTQYLEHRVRQRRIGEDRGQALGVKVADQDVAAASACEWGGRLAREIAGETPGVGGADKGDDQAIGARASLMQIVRHAA
ncbi:MAG: hypothetical protein P8Y93_14115, partial [Acidobacteriota bacterium]